MAIWDDIIPESDQQLYQKAGFGWKRGFGQNPAIVIIDVNYYSVGDKPEPILKSMERFPQSCGENGWRAIHELTSLLPLARDKRVPIIYATRDPAMPRPWRGSSKAQETSMKIQNAYEIVKEIAPGVNDIVIHKLAPSIFLGTPMVNILIPLKIDTLLICGCVTSGCVRASVVDAASHGFKVGVIEECTFDRSEVCHKVNLFDMDAKYADVVAVAEIKDYLNELSVRAQT